MDELRLDFAHYPVNGEMYFEVEASDRMKSPLGQGYAKPDFTNFLNYVVALNLERENLIPSFDGIQVSYRFERLFPELEKNIIKGIMGINSNGQFEEGLVQKVTESIDSMSTLIGAKSEEQKKSLGIYFLDNYVNVSE